MYFYYQKATTGTYQPVKSPEKPVAKRSTGSRAMPFTDPVKLDLELADLPLATLERIYPRSEAIQ